MTSTQNLGDPAGGGPGNPVDPGQELDAVRRHICHILGFDLGLIEVLRPDGLVRLLSFYGDEPDSRQYAIDMLQDANSELLSEANTQIARELVENGKIYLGKCSLKRKPREESAASSFPYAVVPIVEGYDNRRVVKGTLRLVSFDASREIDSDDLQTLQIVGQHLSSRLPSLALQVLRSQDQSASLGDFELKHVLLAHPNRVVRRRLSRTLSSVYRVTEVDDAQKSLDSLATTPADLIVLDAEMKMANSAALLAYLKQKADSKYIPLIAVTSDAGATSRIDALTSGADDCVDENCIDAELLARARSLIRVKKNELELATQNKLLEDQTKRLEQYSEKEREAASIIKKSHAALELSNREIKEKNREAEIRRNQDSLLHRISNTLRRSFNIEENISQMLEELSGWVHLDCSFVVLPSVEEPYDSIRQEYCSDPSFSLMDKDRDMQLLEIFKANFNQQDDLFISDVMRDKKVDPFRKDILSNYHIYSLFYLPITYEGKLHGLLGGHACESEHIWSTDNQNFLRQVADQLSTSVTTARLYRRVERQATTDGLTSLFNHRTGQEKLAEQLRIAERYGRNLCTIMLDVDHFKSINDTYGHPVGDTVLRRVAHIIKRDCRDVDIPVRYGGEEFLIVLPEVNIEGARVVAERLRKTLNREVITHEDIQLSVSASIGVACYPDDAENQHQLLELADKALYMSKRMGRNQVHIAAELKFKEMKEAAQAQAAEAAAASASQAAPPSVQDKEPPSPATLPVSKPVKVSKTEAPSDDSVLVPEVVETVKKMAGALYSKSEYNKIHHLETARFAEMVAKVLGLSAKQVEQIRVASLLHDVGLLHVPEDIINKKGQVTAEELKLLMQHPTLGAEMLRSVPALKEICDILEHHHECWDGTGYPRGMKGDEIPLAARIVAIVEAYHAMISDRPYRPAMSSEKAKRVLKSQAGSQFDPFLVDIFLAVLAEMDPK
ncbi:MAG: diguanylate cyclase [Candidatus Obscuribacterales bacterium]|nr:diguanylate cyclase [Candidatus Obscuribacterales bacterium]